MRLLQFCTDEFDTEGAGREDQLSAYGEDAVRALLAAFGRAGHTPGDVRAAGHGWVGTTLVQDVVFEISVSLVEPADGQPVDELEAQKDDSDRRVASVWYAMIVARPVDPRTLWQRLRGVPPPPVPTIATHADSLLQTAVETIGDVHGIEWHDDESTCPTTF